MFDAFDKEAATPKDRTEEAMSSIFDGKTVSVRKLRRLGIVYTQAQVNDALQAGCKDMPALVAHIERSTATNRRRSHAMGRQSIGPAKFGAGENRG